MKIPHGSTVSDKGNLWISEKLEGNSLQEVTQYFRKAEGHTYHLDRHIIDSPDEIPEKLRDQRDLIYVATFDLCEKWAVEAKELPELIFSVPFVVVDDSWVKGKNNAQPPHIRLCISKSPMLIDDPFPVTAYPSHCHIHGLHKIATERHFLSFRIDGEDGIGSWLFRQKLTR